MKIFRKMIKAAHLPGWFCYRFKNLKYIHKEFGTETSRTEKSSLEQKENLLSSIVLRGKSFLEIGIGEYPQISRLKKMAEAGIKYVAVDFQEVCLTHESYLRAAGVSSENFKFISNRRGTYSWNLMELVRSNQKFDTIYLDGHHTFYVDSPALFLADLLLAEGGSLIMDDIEWSLDFLRANMARRFDDWYFYRKMYNFREYEEYQLGSCHMRLLAEEILLKRLRYEKIPDACLPSWWAMKKAASI
jgi:predicted O-methyltransferase YrrM